MFTLRETKWQLFRNRGRTLILLLASAMLTGCMAFYLGNIQANEAALEQLAKTTTVEVEVTNSTGERSAGINIAPLRRDNFVQNPYLEHFLMSASASGAFGEDARRQDPFVGGDANVVGINALDATWMPDREVTYLDGYDESFLAGDEAQCLVFRDFAERNHIDLGDEISFPIYLYKWKQDGGIEYLPMGEQTLKVVGASYSGMNPQEFLVPVEWLRKVAEGLGLDFTYGTLSGEVKDPLRLNRFKDGILEMSFLEPNPKAQDLYGGATICVDDEQYISSAEVLGENILLFRQFLIPFFTLVIGLIVLAIFLVMRGARRTIAIASSLGRPKLLSALANFFAAFAAELLGCLLTLPAILSLTGLTMGNGLMICGIFLLCACVGNCFGLALILRFDTFTLLTAAE